MAIVLAGAGLLIYARLGADLSQALDRDLRLRAQDLAALVRQPGASLASDSASSLIERGESFAELVDVRGRVVDSTRSLGSAPLLSIDEVARARGGVAFFDRPSVPGLDEPARLLALPLAAGGHRLVLVVGATLENRAEALRSLRAVLLIAGPLALLLATALGYPLAGVGLRAVESMRRRAAEISLSSPGERLPVPASDDELGRLGRTLNEMLDRLERALARERAFVAEAGHELRTPLALLRAELDYALHYADESELREAVRAASEQTDRVVQLASALLLMATADRGALGVRLEELRVRDLMDGVRRRFAWRAGAEGRRIEVDADAWLQIRADPLRLEQAVGNLVENALRHGKGAVTLQARAAGDRVELHVRDEGEGFPPEFLPRVFQRFTRAQEGRAGEGTGLGLAIVATIADAHGGSASAANQPDGGADVTIWLPARPVCPEPEGIAEPVRWRPGAGASAQPQGPAEARRRR